MYQILLPLHSLVRWLVLVFLLIAIFRAYRGSFKKLHFSSFDNSIRMITVGIVQLQFCIGVVLYLLSPVVRYFLHNFKEAVHLREIRFFGMEHITMMIIAVAVISIGSDKVNKLSDPQQKYKTMATWFSIGLLLILTSIPWSFSPLTSRPDFRPLIFQK
jgi:uncharacterized oligopeptide transporter (OPT) family protein